MTKSCPSALIIQVVADTDVRRWQLTPDALASTEPLIILDWDNLIDEAKTAYLDPALAGYVWNEKALRFGPVSVSISYVSMI